MHIKSLSVHYEDGGFALHFVVIAKSNSYSQVVALVTKEVASLPHIKAFEIAQSSRA